VSIPPREDEEPLDEDSPDRLVRGAEERWRPARAARGPRASYRSAQRRERPSQLRWGVFIVAAVVGFAIARFGPFRSNDAELEKELPIPQSEFQSARDRAAQLESERSTTPESVMKAAARAPSAPERERQTAPEQPSEPEPQPEPEREVESAPQPEPAAKREARRELTPEEVLGLEKPAAAPEVTKETGPPAVTTPAPIPDASPESPRPQPDPVTLAGGERSASVYADPDPGAPIVRSASRSVQALVPERGGWTTEAKPTLYWHASQGIQSEGAFVLTREGADAPLLRGRLAAPDGSGIQRIELSQSDVSLEEGASYRWTISFGDPARSETSRATGGIRRVARPASMRAISGAASVSERLDALERAGLWYDALDLVTRSIEDNSGAKNLVARRNAMLARVGIQLSGS